MAYKCTLFKEIIINFLLNKSIMAFYSFIYLLTKKKTVFVYNMRRLVVSIVYTYVSIFSHVSIVHKLNVKVNSSMIANFCLDASVIEKIP